ncbi:uncharacterized protein N7503_001771 [Penicillium pulvis]|uniref:uncharacterized protein n=1 Tax=Penicillium pulvis TaxID=1562058 RepID=UPI002547FBC4|nr:uncharacterized protein N7503_001771 [Penicillium pulvis]KAJ5809553.1 hypothetical protein N7503_001771 [Penicillium pulvis]
MCGAGAIAPPGLTGCTGWETVSARAQEERSSRATFGSTTPTHLTRTFYIPRHDETTSNISIFDISSQYTETVGRQKIGSASYIVSLATMPKPQENGTGLMAAYDGTCMYKVSFRNTVGGSDVAILKSISVASQSSSATQPPTEAFIAAIIIMSNHDGNAATAGKETTVSISYPISPTRFQRTLYVHPYFAFQSPEDISISFEWQMHPLSHGRLRYTLARISRARPVDESAKPVTPSDDDILAIYHDIGKGISLPLSQNEGVLLISSVVGPELENIVVLSALGMLWQLRRLIKIGKGGGILSKISKNRPFDLLK